MFYMCRYANRIACPSSWQHRGRLLYVLDAINAMISRSLSFHNVSLDDQHCDKCTQWSKINSSSETLSEIECPNIQVAFYINYWLLTKTKSQFF